eukprot:2077184-Amphidinium_carterae.1
MAAGFERPAAELSEPPKSRLPLRLGLDFGFGFGPLTSVRHARMTRAGSSSSCSPGWCPALALAARLCALPRASRRQRVEQLAHCRQALPGRHARACVARQVYPKVGRRPFARPRLLPVLCSWQRPAG